MPEMGARLLVLTLFVPTLIGGMSAVVGAQTGPHAPANVRATGEGGSVTITWALVEGADQYVVYQRSRKIFDLPPGTWDPQCYVDGDIHRDCLELASDIKETSYTYTPTLGYHAYWVAACNANGCSPFPAEPVFATAQIPGLYSPGVVARTSDELTINWRARRATHFELHRRLSSADSFILVDSRITNVDYDHEHWTLATETRYGDSGLNPATVYAYRIKACNAYGCSPFSSTGGTTEAAGPVDVPLAPTRVRGRRVERSLARDPIEILWDPVDGATYYEIYRNSDLEAEVSAPQQSFLDTIPLFRLWGWRNYAVLACNKAGCSEPVRIDDGKP